MENGPFSSPQDAPARFASAGPFSLLPTETIMFMMTKLSLPNLVAFIQVNSVFLEIRNNDYFWYQKLMEDYPEYFQYPSCVSNVSWQFIYRGITSKNLRAITVDFQSKTYPLLLDSEKVAISPLTESISWLPHKIWVYRAITSADLYSTLRSLCQDIPITDIEKYSEVDIGILLLVFKEYRDPFVKVSSIYSLEKEPIIHGLSMKGHCSYRGDDITTIFDRLEEIRFEIVFLVRRCPVCNGMSCNWKHASGEPFYHYGLQRDHTEI